jgi:alpha-1,3-rhamnosyl/mannosyltransferase
MRVGLAVDALSPQLTGIGRYTWEICKGLMKSASVTDLGLFRYDSWISDPEVFLRPRRRSILHSIRAPRMVRRWRSRDNFRKRLFHGPNFFLPLRAERGIITVHDLSVLRYPETHPAERVRSFEKFFSRSLSQSVHIITDSQTVRNEIIEDFGISGSNISAISLGIGEQFHLRDRQFAGAILQKYNLRPGGYILSVATFEPRKRIDKAILAHALMCERGKVDFPLVLVGASGWQNFALHSLIDQERAKGRLILLGYVPESELPAIYAGARLFLYPSIYEGFGLPPLEAMAAGVPTIVSKFSCLPEVTGEIPLQIDPDDIEGFGEAIERGLADEQWRTKAADTGIEWAQRYTWDRCVDDTIDIYRHVWDSFK